MNKDTLNLLIDRYVVKIEDLYNAETDELFKWKALKTWNTAWSSTEYASFIDR